MRKTTVGIPAIVFAIALVSTPATALAAGWSAPTTQTVYTLSHASESGATWDSMTNVIGGSKDYPLQFKDGSYLYVPVGVAHYQTTQATMTAATRTKPLWGSSGAYAQIPLAPPTVNGDKRLYVFTVLWSAGPMSTGAGVAAPVFSNAATGLNVNNSNREARNSGNWYDYRLTGGSNIGARSAPWADSDKFAWYWYRGIVGYWRDGSTTRWKVGYWGYNGSEGVGARVSAVATGTGVYTEKANLYVPAQFDQYDPSTLGKQTANIGTDTGYSASVYWYLGNTIDGAAFDLWWDGGSAWAPTSADIEAVMPKAGIEDGWSGGGGSTWTTVTVPATSSVDSSLTSQTVGDIGNDTIQAAWERIWTKITEMLASMTDWFWFLRVWDLENGWGS